MYKLAYNVISTDLLADFDVASKAQKVHYIHSNKPETVDIIGNLLSSKPNPFLSCQNIRRVALLIFARMPSKSLILCHK